MNFKNVGIKFTLLVSGRMPEPADAKFMPVVILFL